MKFTVTNVYDIAGETTHRKVESAVKAAKKREGEGWIVEDEDGNGWWVDGNGTPYITYHA